MTLHELFNKGKVLASENHSSILTAMGVTGVVTTAYLTGRASFKAAEILKREEKLLKAQHPDDVADPRMNRELSMKQKVRAVWPLYITPVSVGATTITSIVMANQVASKKIAALTVASGISERALQEYKAKVVEKIGESKEMAVRDELAQDRVNQTPLNTREIILAGTGDVLCFDQLTGRYFQSNVETIRKAENKINYEILNHMYASLSQFYDEIGLPPTPYSETVGWNTNNLCEVKFSTVMSSDQRPCIAIDFHFLPIADYGRLY